MGRQVKTCFHLFLLLMAHWDPIRGRRRRFVDGKDVDAEGKPGWMKKPKEAIPFQQLIEYPGFNETFLSLLPRDMLKAVLGLMLTGENSMMRPHLPQFAGGPRLVTSPISFYEVFDAPWYEETYLQLIPKDVLRNHLIPCMEGRDGLAAVPYLRTSKAVGDGRKRRKDDVPAFTPVKFLAYKGE